MPPRRAAASTSRKRAPSASPQPSAAEAQPAKASVKRKAAVPPSDNADAESSQQPKKKAKVSETAEIASNGQPTNKVLPVHIEFPPKVAGTLRLAAWNICGLAASSKKVRSLAWARVLEANGS